MSSLTALAARAAADEDEDKKKKEDEKAKAKVKADEDEAKRKAEEDKKREDAKKSAAKDDKDDEDEKDDDKKAARARGSKAERKRIMAIVDWAMPTLPKRSRAASALAVLALGMSASESIAYLERTTDADDSLVSVAGSNQPQQRQDNSAQVMQLRDRMNAVVVETPVVGVGDDGSPQRLTTAEATASFILAADKKRRGETA